MTVKVTGNNITITSATNDSIVRMSPTEIKVKANKFKADNANTTTITPRRVKTRSTKHPSATSNNMTFKADAGITNPISQQSGVIQVVNVADSTQYAVGGSFSQTLALTITTKRGDSTIIFKMRVCMGREHNRYGMIRLRRDDVVIDRMVGDRSSNTGRSQGTVVVTALNLGNYNDNYMLHEFFATFTDTPNTTSAVEYSLWAKRSYGSGSGVYINRNYHNGTAAYHTGGITFLTAFEIITGTD